MAYSDLQTAGISNNTHWFKKIFLGLMGSVALTKAVDCYYQGIWRPATTMSLPALYIRLKDGHAPFSFIVISHLLLLYFFANIIRYYMAIYIYDRVTDELWQARSALKRNYSAIFEDDHVVSQIDKELDKDESYKKESFKRVSSTIVDIMLSLLVFFLFGVAALSLSNINGFALISSLILVIDIIHIYYQQWTYFPQKYKIEYLYKNAVARVLASTKATDPNRYSALKKDGLLEELATNPENTLYKKTLNVWKLIDLFELACWLSMIYLCHFLPEGPDRHKYSWWCILPICGLFVSYFLDLKRNKEAWADMFDVHVK